MNFKRGDYFKSVEVIYSNGKHLILFFYSVTSRIEISVVLVLFLCFPVPLVLLPVSFVSVLNVLRKLFGTTKILDVWALAIFSSRVLFLKHVLFLFYSLIQRFVYLPQVLWHSFCHFILFMLRSSIISGEGG